MGRGKVESKDPALTFHLHLLGFAEMLLILLGLSAVVHGVGAGLRLGPPRLGVGRERRLPGGRNGNPDVFARDSPNLAPDLRARSFPPPRSSRQRGELASACTRRDGGGEPTPPERRVREGGGLGREGRGRGEGGGEESGS